MGAWPSPPLALKAGSVDMSLPYYTLMLSIFNRGEIKRISAALSKLLMRRSRIFEIFPPAGANRERVSRNTLSLTCQRGVSHAPGRAITRVGPGLFTADRFLYAPESEASSPLYGFSAVSVVGSENASRREKSPSCLKEALRPLTKGP